MGNTRKLTVSDLELLENKLRNIVEGSVAESVSALPIVKDLYLTCKEEADYLRVKNFIDNNPNATRNDILSLFVDIQRDHEKKTN